MTIEVLTQFELGHVLKKRAWNPSPRSGRGQASQEGQKSEKQFTELRGHDTLF